MLLEVHQLTGGYGSAQVLFDVSLSLGAGEVVALMGRNGMGKTTTIRNIMGLNRPWGGHIHFDGRAIQQRPAHINARAGLGLVPEGRRCFATLSVEENLIATARPALSADGWRLSDVEALFPVLGERSTQSASTLSGGEQQMLAIGRALLTNPKLLILDEATEGLAPVIRQQIWAALRMLKAKGQSILLVDKSLKEMASVADRAVLLEKGRSVWTGEFGALSDDLQRQYLGV